MSGAPAARGRSRTPPAALCAAVVAVLLLALLSGGAALAQAAAEPGPPEPSSVAIGVLPFEGVGPPGASVPDAARRLADRLATRGVGRVVGPEGFPEAPTFAPSREQVQAWAAEAQVDALVVGRVTRIGQRISLDLRLRAADSARTISTHVAEAARPGELDAAVDRLVDQIVREARAAGIRPVPAVAARGAREDPAPPPARPSASAGSDAGGGDGASGEEGFLGTGRGDEPINIRSGELEAFEEGGERRFVFRRDVEVRQGDLRLTSERLEAFYPQGSSQPDRLEASGRVVVLQGDREARCDRATYLRGEGRVLCFGDDAVLVQGGDRVQGKEIEFDLDTERLVVRGGADVQLQPGDTGGTGGGGA